MKKKISWEEYYLNIAKQVCVKSTCRRNKFGAVIVRDNQIISTGYNGAPRKTKDCFEHGNCLREKLGVASGERYELCRSVHAEQNAIINAARAGVSLLNGNIYIYGEKVSTGKPLNTYPCFICKKMLINAGLNKVICSTEKKIEIYNISDWVKEWQEKDIIDGKQYK